MLSHNNIIYEKTMNQNCFQENEIERIRSHLMDMAIPGCVVRRPEYEDSDFVLVLIRYCMDRCAKECNRGKKKYKYE